jgi:hypothetical protein
MRAVAARVRVRSRGDAPAVEQSADRGYGKRVSAKQTSRRVCMGSSEGRQGARGRPGQRREVMRPPRFDAEVAMRNEPVAARLPSAAAVAVALPAVHSTLSPALGARSRSTNESHFAPAGGELLRRPAVSCALHGASSRPHCLSRLDALTTPYLRPATSS